MSGHFSRSLMATRAGRRLSVRFERHHPMMLVLLYSSERRPVWRIRCSTLFPKARLPLRMRHRVDDYSVLLQLIT